MSERRRRVTINDVAALAGVSKGAVSRSFNGASRLPESTVKRIHDAAEQLGWRPNAAARAIQGAPARTIGFVVRRDPALLGSDPFFPLFLAGVERVLSAHAYGITIRFVTSEEEETRCYRDWVAESRVDGVIVSDLRDGDPRFALLDELDLPGVIVGDPGRAVSQPAVYHTTDASIRELVDGWVQRGHTRIAHVTGDPNLRHTLRRRAIWADALATHGLGSDLFETGWFTEDGAKVATRALLAAAEPPTAIFYANDIMAAAGMGVLADAGRTVGGDIAVAGFDGIPLAQYLSPPLATIVCDFDELGDVVGGELMTLLSTDGSVPPVTTLAGRFLPRASYELRAE
ncbi:MULTISPECIES: LacI family DNA-binding transcriptional regulator [Microbacterium]|uniref:LacI family transcriptional regulator n=1 Tax=Microbacterium wangchenii TaxID=2541726 RepID=A0ABX5SQF9_9MICO|nr:MULTISPECIES: LacI family DNA-binding transcriptional regulator [Microbacterium]MCK6064899.1 LacI family transcriptional regulator [Microbacterium sp. EYE_512]QBR88383.1 LacI family transcriptional regulator [Microbacterium wangchenii]TFV82566.1 LacI family transcriptional regulator [Microbacterium sp. dk485]